MAKRGNDVRDVFPRSELDRLPLCDTVLIAFALVPETRGLIDAGRLGLVRPGALLINVARAAIVDEDALCAALKDGHLGGAALVVWWQYPTQVGAGPAPSHRRWAADWALVYLKQTIGSPDRVLPILNEPSEDGADVVLGGYHHDHPLVLLADTNRQVVGRLMAIDGKLRQSR